MARTTDMIRSIFINKNEVKSGPLVLTVRDCTLEKVGGEERWVLWFHEHPKGITLNNTKIKQLELAFGDETRFWIGRRVRLSFDPAVMMAGQVVGGIKLACSSAHAGAAPAPQPAMMAHPAHGAPPQPVWDERAGAWVIPSHNPPAAAPAPAPRPLTVAQQANRDYPAGDFVDRATGEILPKGDPARPQVGSALNEFDDDVPF